MTTYRTASIFHFTSIDRLKSIIINGFVPNYCREDFSVKSGQHFIVGIPMVSFCDIPLMRINEFKLKYGECAIGLKKTWGLRNKINPVFYINNEDIISALKFYRSYQLSLDIKLEQSGNSSADNAMNINLNDKNSVSRIPDFLNNANSRYANLNLFGFSKKYRGVRKGTGQEECNYDENEWRYVVKESGNSGIKWKWSETEYDTWRKNHDKSKPDDRLSQMKLVFNIDDVSHILVNSYSQIGDIIDFIDQLSHVGGGVQLISREEKNKLLVCVNTFDRIAEDY